MLHVFKKWCLYFVLLPNYDWRLVRLERKLYIIFTFKCNKKNILVFPFLTDSPFVISVFVFQDLRLSQIIRMVFLGTKGFSRIVSWRNWVGVQKLFKELRKSLSWLAIVILPIHRCKNFLAFFAMWINRLTK